MGGDWFDDWVVGLQFEPDALANRAIPVGRQMGRFYGTFGYPILGLWSPRASAHFSAGFWRSVSASQNSVPGGSAPARIPTAFAAAIAIFEPA
jgi:hypothetical protein